MRANTKITFAIVALIIAHAAFAQGQVTAGPSTDQPPQKQNIFDDDLMNAIGSNSAASEPAKTTHRSGKELYDEMMQSEQRGRAMWDQIFKGLPGDDKKLWSNLQEGVAAEDELEKLAKTGDIDARYYMGLIHSHYGELDLASARQDPNNSMWPVVADREFKGAVEWLKPLADQNIPQAQWVYGELFASGHGVNKSSSNAVELWFKAAKTYLKAGDREDALTLFDMMRNADQSNPRVTKLQKLLFQK